VRLVEYREGRDEITASGGQVYNIADYPATRHVLDTQEALQVRVDDPDGDDAELRVPVGTQLVDGEGRIVADLTLPAARVVVARVVATDAPAATVGDRGRCPGFGLEGRQGRNREATNNRSIGRPRGFRAWPRRSLCGRFAANGRRAARGSR